MLAGKKSCSTFAQFALLGPAKVYTYRGKLRQYFLRVSIDNRDTYGPANLIIDQKRILKAFVEPVSASCVPDFWFTNSSFC